MNVEEMQRIFDEMFPDGVRFNNDTGSESGFIFWVARPVALAESAFLVKPVGSDFMVPYTFTGEPQIDDNSITFINDTDGRMRVLQMDTLFEPVGLEELIEQERSEMDADWVGIQRTDYENGAL